MTGVPIVISKYYEINAYLNILDQRIKLNTFLHSQI
jgi:hypothetical protein